MKKIILLVTLMLLISGCASKDINKSYDKMKISDSSINGYTINVSIIGKIDNENIDQLINIENFMNTDYKIVSRDARSNGEGVEVIYTNDGPIYLKAQEVVYVSNGDIFVQDEQGNYVLTTNSTNFDNPNIYIDTIKNVAQKGNYKEVVIEKNAYRVYDIKVDKKTALKLAEDSGYNINASDIDGKVYIDENGYIYQIIYEFDDVTMTAIFSNIGKQKSIDFPSNMR